VRALRRHCLVPVTAVLLAAAVLGSSVPAADRPKSDKLRIGVLESLFKGLPKTMALAASQPFRALMETQSGLQGELAAAGDVGFISQQLHEDKIDLAVFQGFEFAWARHKYPDFRPLMIAVNGSRHLQAHVLVQKQHPAQELADLKGKSLASPRTNRDHCRLYAERTCRTFGQTPLEFFGQTPAPVNAEDALDDVVDGTLSAVLVDGAALESYKRRKPVRFDKLRELAKSEIFPAGVIAYRQGGLEASKVRRLRDGLIAANQTAYGRQLLTLWKLTGFERVPDDYEQCLSDILKAYPPPADLSK